MRHWLHVRSWPCKVPHDRDTAVTHRPAAPSLARPLCLLQVGRWKVGTNRRACAVSCITAWCLRASRSTVGGRCFPRQTSLLQHAPITLAQRRDGHRHRFCAKAALPLALPLASPSPHPRTLAPPNPRLLLDCFFNITLLHSSPIPVLDRPDRPFSLRRLCRPYTSCVLFLPALGLSWCHSAELFRRPQHCSHP
jgi:hypothetical protein